MKTAECSPRVAGPRPRSHSRRALLTAGALCLLLVFSMLCIVTVAGAGVSSSSALCSAASRSACASFPQIVPAGDGESQEAEEEASEETEEEDIEASEARSEESGPSASSPSNRAAGSPQPNPGSTPPPTAHAAVVSHLRLTTRAAASLQRRMAHIPKASMVEFSFTLSAPTKVTVTLVKQTRSANHEWATLPDSLNLTAAKGHVSHRLRGHNKLLPGLYRLTVKPLGGAPRSIYLKAHR